MRNVDLFDDYLTGRLNADEKHAFELRLDADTELRNEFNMHKLFFGTLKDTLAQNDLRNRMNVIHEKEFGKSNVISIAQKPNYFKVAAVAASVSLFVFLSGFLIYQFGFNKHSSYQEVLMSKFAEELDDAKQDFENNIKSRTVKNFAPANLEATGFAISSKGYFLTSLHSVQNSDSVMVLNDQLDYVSADKVWEDAKLDVAIYKISNSADLKFSEMPIAFKPGTLDLGEKVFAIGYPRETAVYSEGNISAASGLNGDTTKYQLSMLINPGNSGSPVLDEQGNLIGIISGRNNNAQGVSYAVKAQYIFDMIKSIPDERLRKEILLNGKNSIKKMRRTDQVKKLRPYVFNVKVYKSKD
jgi:serine protease Do